MDEQEALGNYCRTMTLCVRDKQQHMECSEMSDRRRHRREGRQRTEPDRRDVAESGFRNQRARTPTTQRADREGDQASHRLMCQGPAVLPVPLELMSLLRFKTLTEQMRQAAEVELHDPDACSMCEQETASLALKRFIRRKKTQLQLQTLTGRLNTKLSYRGLMPKSSGAPNGIWEELLG